MKQAVLELFSQYPHAAILISLLASIIVAVLGLLPSFFITAANIVFFGFRDGLLISLAGEALGAIVAFVLYRKGFGGRIRQKLHRYPRAQKLLEAEGRRAFFLVVALRLIPFVPSGLVTFAAAVGRVSAAIFIAASTIGKVPALVLEAWSVYEVARLGWQGKLVLAVLAAGIIFFLVQKGPAK